MGKRIFARKRSKNQMSYSDITIIFKGTLKIKYNLKYVKSIKPSQTHKHAKNENTPNKKNINYKK